ncbi:MAG: flagellar biosynthetic protein FliO [Pseudomonadota bacterium]
MSQTLWFFFAFVIVLALIGAAAWLVRRFGGSSIGSNSGRGRMPRLAVIDAAAVDGRRRLVLVRRDNVEHLLMIGGPTDIVVEPNIVRSIPQRDQAPQRSPAGTELPPAARLPDTAWDEAEPSRAETFDFRDTPVSEPSRPPRVPYSDEMRRPPAAIDRHAADSMPSFAPEPMVRPDHALRTEPMLRAESPTRAIPRSERNEPVPPRMPRSNDLAHKAPPPVARPSPRPAEPPLSSADQNLADMAQRLEAALRRPGAELRLDGGESRAPSVSQMDRVGAPSVAPEPPPSRPPPRPESGPVRSAEPPVPPAPPAAKAAFENLEDEMASLLGRPKPPA